MAKDCLEAALKCSMDADLLRVGEFRLQVKDAVHSQPLTIRGTSSITIEMTEGYNLSSGGVQLANPYTWEGAEKDFTIPSGNFEIRIIDAGYGINKLALNDADVIPDNYNFLATRVWLYLWLRNNTNLQNQDIISACVNSPHLGSIALNNDMALTCNEIDVLRYSDSLIYSDLYPTNMYGSAEEIYALHASKGTARTCTYIHAVRVTFNGNDDLPRHLVTYDGNGNAVVKNNGGTVLGSYDGTTWTYPS